MRPTLRSFAPLLFCALLAACGPPPVELTEAYEADAGEAVFDHSVFDTLLERFVDEDGWVDYAGLAADSTGLDAYVASLATAPFDSMGRDEKLALLINGYNAFTLRLILDHYPLDSIRDIPSNQRWDGRTWQLGGNEWTLTEIEHEQVRPNFVEPRIHFALNCASIGCPPLRREAFTGARLEEQLADQMLYTHTRETRDRWLRYDADSNTARLSRLYDWYAGDFEQVSGTALDYVAQFSTPIREAIDRDEKPSVQWLDYSWVLNDITQRPGN